MDEVIEQLRKAPTCDVQLAGQAFGISRGLAYEQARTGSLGGVPVVKVGHRLRVLTRPLLKALGYDPDPTPDQRSAA